MNSRIRAFLRDVLPPFIVRMLRRQPAMPDARISLGKAHADWASASRASTGYDGTKILETVDAATQAVVTGRAAFERDGVTFAEASPPLPLVAGLLHAASHNSQPLRVLDFGGSLGSSYRQCKAFLDTLASVEWRVVEQDAFVSLGRRQYETKELRFFHSIAEATVGWTPDVVLVSGALHYIEHPMKLLDEIAACGSACLIIDRTPLTPLAAHCVVVQQVPASIYPASYPCWLFSKEALLAQLRQDWDLLASFPALDGVFDANGIEASFTGMILRRLPAARTMG